MRRSFESATTRTVIAGSTAEGVVAAPGSVTVAPRVEQGPAWPRMFPLASPPPSMDRISAKMITSSMTSLNRGWPVTPHISSSATPLFMALVLIEIADVIFAVDSIPAIFAITSDPFIVLTSNVFAILGLRAMYFLLAAVANKFHLLNYGLAVILVFIGTKMCLIDIYKIPVLVSLGVVVAILAITMLWSVKTAPRIAVPER